MKPIKMFVILLIGMISLTVTGATFTNPEQKQKTEFTEFFDFQDLVVVDYGSATDFIFNGDSTELLSVQRMKVKAFDFVLPSLYKVDICLWQNYNYKEKLNKDLRLEVLSVQRDFMPDLLKS